MTFHHYITLFIRVPIFHEWLINWVLAPLSAVFQLYGDQLLVMEEAGVLASITDHEQAIGKLYHLWLVQYTYIFFAFAVKNRSPYDPFSTSF
jgi:hypothetical protein